MTTDTLTRSNVGGFEPRFNVTRTDGQPISDDRHYIVLAYDGSDPEATQALQYYAYLKGRHNPTFGEALTQALQDPTGFPKQHD